MIDDLKGHHLNRPMNNQFHSWFMIVDGMKMDFHSVRALFNENDQAIWMQCKFHDKLLFSQENLSMRMIVSQLVLGRAVERGEASYRFIGGWFDVFDAATIFFAEFIRPMTKILDQMPPQLLHPSTPPPLISPSFVAERIVRQKSTIKWNEKRKINPTGPR